MDNHHMYNSITWLSTANSTREIQISTNCHEMKSTQAIRIGRSNEPIGSSLRVFLISFSSVMSKRALEEKGLPKAKKEKPSPEVASPEVASQTGKMSTHSNMQKPRIKRQRSKKGSGRGETSQLVVNQSMNTTASSIHFGGTKVKPRH